MARIDPYDALRLRIEAGRTMPLTVCVASATAEDGAGEVALALAAAFRASGSRALAVLESDGGWEANGNSPVPVDTLSSILKGAIVTQPNGVDTVCLPARGERERRVASHTVNRERRIEARDSFLALRRTYSAIVLEANEAATRSAMLERATFADLAVVAIRLGRASCSADRELMERLEALGVPVLGVAHSSGTKPSEALGAKRPAFSDLAIRANPV